MPLDRFLCSRLVGTARPCVLLSRQRTRVRTAHNRAEAFAPPSRKATFPAPVIPGGPPVSPFVAYSNPHVGTNLQGWNNLAALLPTRRWVTPTPQGCFRPGGGPALTAAPQLAATPQMGTGRFPSSKALEDATAEAGTDPDDAVWPRRWHALTQKLLSQRTDHSL